MTCWEQITKIGAIRVTPAQILDSHDHFTVYSLQLLRLAPNR